MRTLCRVSVSAVALAVLTGLVGLALGSIATRAMSSARRRRSADTEAGRTVAEILQRTVSNAPVGVLVVDSTRGVPVMNSRVSEMGVMRDGVLDERLWKVVQRTLATGQDTEVDLSAPRGLSGRRAGLAVHGTIRLLSDQSPRMAVVYLDDQSEQVRMEASRRDFVANVSHELKTPVAAMAVLSEALLESTDDPDTVQRFGGKIYTESQRLANMVGELIELSRLQGAERLPDLVAVDVDTVVQEAISRHKVVAEKENITVKIDDETGLQVLGDEALLVTAIANLISNAIAYSPRGSTVSISRRRHGDMVEIAVTDRGIGIALEDQERVFERFFRVDKARSRATGGTGLGLAIVKHVAANHNGNIRLWSRRGTGSTFTLSIPAYGGQDADDNGDQEEQ
jgi:two-component system sensor histidine kinase SenX3